MHKHIPVCGGGGMADALLWGGSGSILVWVQVPFSAPAVFRCINYAPDLCGAYFCLYFSEIFFMAVRHKCWISWEVQLFYCLSAWHGWFGFLTGSKIISKEKLNRWSAYEGELMYMQTYRSGHNENDSKSFVLKSTVGSNPTVCATSVPLDHLRSQFTGACFYVYASK